MNANEIGWGYDKPGSELKDISARNAAGISWAAMFTILCGPHPDFKHLVRKVTNGPTLHVIYNYKPNNEG